MDLREKLAARQAAAAEQERQNKLAEEEAAAVAVRQQIADLETKKQRIEESASALEGALSSVTETKRGFRKTHDEIEVTRKAYPDLAEDSVHDFLEENKDTKEVGNYLDQRTDLRERAGVLRLSKTGAREKAEVSAKSLTSAELAAATREEAAKVGREIEELKLQTPEGKAQIEAKKEILQARIGDPAPINRNVDRVVIITDNDLQLAERWGVDFVKSTLRDHYNSRIDHEVEDKKKEKGLAAEELQDHERIRASTWKTWESFKTMGQKRTEALNAITQALMTDQGFCIKYGRTASGRIDTKSAEVLAEKMLARIVGGTELGKASAQLFGSKDAGEAFTNFYDREPSKIGQLNIGWSQRTLVDVPNLDLALAYSQKYAELFEMVKPRMEEDPTKFMDALGSPEVTQFGKEAVGQHTTRTLRFDALYQAMDRRLISPANQQDIGAFIESELAKVDQEGEKLKRAVAARIDSAWAAAKLRVFEETNRGTLPPAAEQERIKKENELVTRLLNDLDNLRQHHRDSLQRQIVVRRDGRDWIIEWKDNLDKRSDFKAQREQLDATKNRLIAQERTDREAYLSASFMKGRKEKKWKDSEAEVINIEREIDDNIAEIKSLDQAAGELKGFRNWLGAQMDRMRLPEGTGTLEDLFGRIESRIRALGTHLPEDKAELLKQHQELNEEVRQLVDEERRMLQELGRIDLGRPS